MSRWWDSPTVLVVAHRRDSRQRYRRLLGDYDVRTAGDAAAALDAAGEDVDVVLLERDLGERSGDDVLSRVRSADFDCRVAVVTAADPDEDLVGLGYDASLTEPVTEAELTAVVDRLGRLAAYVEAVEAYHAACQRRADGREDGADGVGVDGDLAALRDRVDELAAGFDAEDYRVVFRDLDEQP